MFYVWNTLDLIAYMHNVNVYLRGIRLSSENLVRSLSICVSLRPKQNMRIQCEKEGKNTTTSNWYIICQIILNIDGVLPYGCRSCRSVLSLSFSSLCFSSTQQEGSIRWRAGLEPGFVWSTQSPIRASHVCVTVNSRRRWILMETVKAAGIFMRERNKR